MKFVYLTCQVWIDCANFVECSFESTDGEMIQKSWKSTLILFVQLSLLLSFIIVVALSGRHSIFRGEQIVGIFLLLAGAVVLSAAVVAYRKSMGTLRVKVSPDPAEHGGLITRGVYSKIRHPFYAATPLMLTGAMLVLQRPWCVIVVICTIPLLFWKSSYEEQLLVQKFPEYSTYRKRTGRFFPRLMKKNFDSDK